MRYERKKKVVIMSCLLALVISLGIGFAAFSTTLKINGKASINPDASNFKVVFASGKSGNDYLYEEVLPVVSPVGLEALNGHIDNSVMPTINNLSGTFTEDNQSVTYNFLIANIGKYDAYLTNAFVDDKECSIAEGSDADPYLVEEACEHINLTVYIGEGDEQILFGETTEFESRLLEAGQDENIKVVISYDEDGDLADGEFLVTFGDVSLAYKTIDDSLVELADVTDTTCFSMYREGEINNYDTSCGPNVVIDHNIQVPLSEITGYTFNNELCLEHIDELDDSDASAQDKCDYVASAISGMEYDELVGTIYSAFCNFETIVTDSYYNVEKLGVGAFAVSGLESVVIGEGIDEISDYAFVYNNISDLEIYDSVTKIGNSAFFANNLTKVKLPKSLKRIEYSAFENNKLEKLTVPSTVEYVGEGAFSNNQLSSLTIGAKVIDIGAFSDNEIRNVEFLEGVEEIYENAFRNNHLKSVSLPESIKKIDYEAFYQNEINDVYIGSNIQYIGGKSFTGNISRVRINVPETNKSSITVHSNAFNWVSGKDNDNIEWIG